MLSRAGRLRRGIFACIGVFCGRACELSLAMEVVLSKKTLIHTYTSVLISAHEAFFSSDWLIGSSAMRDKVFISCGSEQENVPRKRASDSSLQVEACPLTIE